jgi:hypothetical protein
LGLTIAEAELGAIAKLARRIQNEGEVELGGSSLDAMLDPSLEHLEVEDLDDLDEDALKTVGGAIASFRLLAADPDGGDNASLVPSAYVPIAISGSFEVVGLIGVSEKTRGRYFEIAPEGQNQSITSDADVSDLGVFSDRVG